MTDDRSVDPWVGRVRDTTARGANIAASWISLPARRKATRSLDGHSEAIVTKFPSAEPW